MRISVRQICFIMVAYTAATKLLIYPTMLSWFCDGAIIFPALINFIVCGAVIWALSFLCSKTDKTFFGLLQNTFGEIGARIVYGFFAVFFLFAALLPIFEQKQYVHNIFYDTVPPLGVFLPFFIFAAYAASRKFGNIGRCADICLPIFAGTMFLLFIMSFSDVKADDFLPMFSVPATTIFSTAARTAFNFVEPCWLLMFMGHFKYKKGDAAKITLSYAAGAAIVILFLALFHGIYGPIAPSRTFAVARISLFFPAIETMGRIDLILLYVLEVVMLFAVVINLQLAVHTIAKCSGFENYVIISLATNAVFAIILFIFDSRYNAIVTLYSQWLWIAFIVFAVPVPALAWTLRRRTR